jgi:ferredoxin
MDEWMLPTIDLSRCTGCGLCVKHCPTHAVVMVEGQPQIVHPHACTYCAMCEDFCPVGAISLVYDIVPTHSE